MTFEWADFLFVTNPGTLGALLVVGFAFGALFYRDRRDQRVYLYLTGFVGVVFMATMTTVRLAQGADQWEGWLGSAILWLVYGFGINIGARVGRRLRGPDRPE